MNDLVFIIKPGIWLFKLVGLINDSIPFWSADRFPSNLFNAFEI